MKIKDLDGKRKPPPSSLPEGKCVMPSLYIDIEVRNELSRIANEERVNRNELIRYILTKFVEDYNKK